MEIFQLLCFPRTAWNKNYSTRVALNAPSVAHLCDVLWRILKGEIPRKTSAPARKAGLNHKARQEDRRTIGCLYENRAPPGVLKIVNKKSPRSNPSQDTAESSKQATCNIPHAAPEHPDQMDMSSCVMSRSLASSCTKGAPT